MSDCIVVGGGLIGMLCAHQLSAAGMRVTLLERSEPGRESSWAGGGILAPLYPWRYPAAVNRLADWSTRHYEAFCLQLAEDTGLDPQWTQNGLLIAGIDDRADAERWCSVYRGSAQWCKAGALREIEPQLAVAPATNLWLEDIAQVRNPRLMHALLAAVRKQGVEVRQSCPVTGWVRQGARVQAVQTPAGEFSAARYIVASGAWSGEVLASLGVQFPIQPVRGQMLLFKGAPGLLSRIVLYGGHYAIPRRDGRILFGSTLEYCGFEKQTTDEARQLLERCAVEMLPCLAGLPVEKHWAGLRPGSPDGTPVIGPHPRLENVFINAGHFRHGVVMGLASARLLTDQLLGRPAILDSSAYLPEIHAE